MMKVLPHWSKESIRACEVIKIRQFGPTLIIAGRDSDDNIFEIPENLNIQIISPEDPLWLEGEDDEYPQKQRHMQFSFVCDKSDWFR
jgi:hypothetical protein